VGAYSVPPDPPAGTKGTHLYGREECRERKGKKGEKAGKGRRSGGTPVCILNFPYNSKPMVYRKVNRASTQSV